MPRLACSPFELGHFQIAGLICNYTMDRWLPANLYSAGRCLSSDCAARSCSPVIGSANSADKNASHAAQVSAVKCWPKTLSSRMASRMFMLTLPRPGSAIISGSSALGSSLAQPLKQGPAIAIMTVILIVEDDVLANEHLEFILQQAGYEVASATSADEAAAYLKIVKTCNSLLPILIYQAP